MVSQRKADTRNAILMLVTFAVAGMVVAGLLRRGGNSAPEGRQKEHAVPRADLPQPLSLAALGGKKAQPFGAATLEAVRSPHRSAIPQPLSLSKLSGTLIAKQWPKPVILTVGHAKRVEPGTVDVTAITRWNDSPKAANRGETVAIKSQRSGLSASLNGWPKPVVLADGNAGNTEPVPLDLLSGINLTDAPDLELQRQAAESAGQDAAAKITLTGDFEGAFLPPVTMLSPTHFALDFQNQEMHMFLFKVTGAAGRSVRIDLNNVALQKWHSLNPVFSYARRLDDPAAFESLPPKVQAAPLRANNGPLLPDTRGQAWHFINNVWTSGDHTLSLVEHFDQDAAFVAMKYPYTVGYNEAFLKRISSDPYVTVEKIGNSKEGRPLLIVKIAEGTKEEQKFKPCILMYAREHADEHDTSWIVNGAIHFLLSDGARAIREKNIFLFIPILDPDAATMEIHENVITTFRPEIPSKESLAYAEYFKHRADQDYRLDVVINLHNVESAEAFHLSCPMANPHEPLRSCGLALLDRTCERLKALGFSVNNKPWSMGSAFDNTSVRLGGWLRDTYGALHEPYEVNSQESVRHLSIAELRQIGVEIISETANYLKSDSGAKLMAEIDRSRRERIANWQHFGGEINSKSALSSERAVRWKAQSQLKLDAMTSKE